jgi:hypothetical protein
MVSGSSKEAMDIAVSVESIEERQARTRLWIKIKNYTTVAVEQVMDMITGVLPGYKQEDMADVLQFSAEHCAAVMEKAGEPVDAKAVWEAYDNSVKLLDIVVLIPSQWEKYLDPKFWDLPPLEHVPSVPPLGRKDFEKLKKMPGKHQLHLDKLAAFEPKYRIAA